MKRSKKLKIVGTIALAIAVAGVAAYVVHKSKEQKKNESKKRK